ncbi:MAG: PEP-CTERM sorting domain-containing protein, partial [Planctomycetaceae bacterium]
WVDGPSGGSELYNYNGTSWTRLGATWDGTTYPYPYTVTPGAQSTVEWTFPLSVFGLAEGNRFYFDVYSSGGGGGDSAIDSLANPNISVTDWGGDPAASPPGYTSYAGLFGGPGLNSYKIAAVPEPSTMAMAAAAVLSGGLLLRRRKRVS